MNARPKVALRLPGALPRGGRLRVEVRRIDDGAVVGQFYMDASQVRGELDRVNGRWVAIKRAAATLPEGDALRASITLAWSSWRRFYEDAYDDWLAWSTNVAEADRFDREADEWRAALEARGLEVANPTTSETVPRPSVPSFGLGIGTGLGLALGALVLVYAVTR